MSLSTRYPTQEFRHDPEQGVVGDCWRACIAGLIGWDLADVPHFARDFSEEGDPEPEWWSETKAFVEAAIEGVTIICRAPEFPVYVSGSWPVAIATGVSPRSQDVLHAVLVDPVTGGLVWDPHPDRTGLVGPSRDVFAIVSVESEGGS